MPVILISEPEEEPLSLVDAKLFLRVEHDAEDALITNLIRAARRHVETQTGRRLVTQIWRLVLDAWPLDGVIALPIAPVAVLEGARLRAVDGSASELDLSGWTFDAASARVHVAHRPRLLRAFAGIEVDVTAGYGGAEDVPPVFVQAIRLLVGHWYEHRAEAVTRASMPLAAAALMAPERALRI